ncbi:hypothetical protein BR1R5_11210 [Pseudomonas sp. BR1R-5]|nr:hypothetical protein EGJ09_04375 [Pseudomonas sp. p106]GLH31735.1 hypothetical protein BR1R5_11210 [Pseudomonas sp. BR1R-5]
MAMKEKQRILPRIIRAGSAPAYLGMCRDEFHKTVRPYVREFPIGIQGVGFDRYELDDWADAYIAMHSTDKRPRVVVQPPAEKPNTSTTYNGLTFKETLELVAPKKRKKA